MSDTITLPRSVLEQALEILDSLLPATTKDYFPAWLPQDAIDSLKCRDSVRAALEQPQPQSGGIPPDWKRRLGNLLAVIHGDGGHYIDAHGWEKAQADAEKKIAKVMTDSAQSKPVAYRHLHEDGWEYYDAPTGSDCDDCQALYTHPQPPVVEQEPVAWMWSSGGNKSSLTFGGPNSNTPKDWDVQPLYTHPQPRQPLTDAEILMVLYAADIPDLPRDFKDVDIDIARAIEAAHEIGGEA